MGQVFSQWLSLFGLHPPSDLVEQLLVLEAFDDLLLVFSRPDQTQNGWKEHEAVPHSEDDDEQVHSEVVQTEQGAWGEGKDDHADELGGGDTNQDGGAHLGQGCVGPLLPSSALLHEVHTNVITELHSKAKRGHQVDHEHGILFNWIAAEHFVEQIHESHQLEEHQEHAESNENRDLNRGQDLNSG